MSTQANLQSIKSSIAEAGNKGLRRIKKSLSYMNRDNAYLLSKVYIDMQNRRKLIKMYASGVAQTAQ